MAVIPAKAGIHSGTDVSDATVPEWTSAFAGVTIED
jgi:hypothetical protein